MPNASSKRSENEVAAVMPMTYFEETPRLVQFETLCGCNARCTFCCYPTMKRARGKMTWEMIEAIISQAEGAQTLLPFLLGEPLLDERMRQILQLCKIKQPQATTQLYSNMALCDDKVARWLVEDQTLDTLCPSFYAPNASLYAQLQPPLDFHQVRANILGLVAVKHRTGVAKPRIKMQYILMDSTAPAMGEFIKYWRALADEIEIAAYDTWHGDQPERHRGKRVPPGRIPCSRLWQGLNIHHDGTAVACCIDYEQQAVIGRFPEQSLREIWHGRELAELRRLHLEGRQNEIPLCRHCTSWISNPPWWIGFWEMVLYGGSNSQQDKAT